MNPRLVKILKAILIDSPLSGYIFPRYRFWLSPPQLCFLCHCLAETKHIEGAVCEVGCATGWTTVFLNKYMDAEKIEKPYYAIDTFSGFVAEDINFEVSYRGKTKELFTGFRTNNKTWFDKTMQQDGITRVRSIAADVNRFDFKTVAPVSFAFLDVDLYRPTKAALRELHAVLSPGAIVVVDDCDPSHVCWDGADQAYKEFIEATGQCPEVVHGKFGIVRKSEFRNKSPQPLSFTRSGPAA